MKKLLFYLLIIFCLLWHFRKETKDSDYMIDVEGTDTVPSSVVDSSLFVKPDTAQYKGNWVDPQ